jgi:DNA-binding MarR family transcriptional regulator
MKSSARDDRRWSFVTSHARVLAYIAHDPSARLREIAAGVGITERRTVQIVRDLEDGGYVEKTREGRRNRYALAETPRLRHTEVRTLLASPAIALLLDAFEKQPFG